MDKPIRVLHVLQRMEAGGTQTLLMNLYRNIDRSKVQFDFFVEYPEKQFYDDEIEKLGGKIYYNTFREDFNILKFQKNFEKVLTNHVEYNIVHVHAYTVGYFILKVAKKCGVPVRIVHSHNNETTRDSKYLIKRLLQKLYPIYATDFFACSEDAGKYLFKNRNYIVLKNAIDSKQFIANKFIREQVRKDLNLEHAFIVGHVGRMHPQKNHKFLLEIFKEISKKIPNAALVLVGTGPLEKEVREQAAGLNVHFLGNRKDMSRIYQAFDIFLLPSLFEGLGIVAIEAQASGIPCLCSNRVSKDANVSPLFHSMELEAGAVKWAENSLQIANDKLAHQNTQSFIIKAGYDVHQTAKIMEDYYIQKSKDNESEH